MWSLLQLADYIASSSDIRHFSFFLHNTPGEVIDKRDKFPVVLAVEKNHKIVVYGHLETFPGNSNKTHVVKLGLYVHPEARRLGYGSQMVAALKEKALTKGYTKIWLSVYEDNDAARQLYLKCGFTVEGIFRNEELWGGKYRNVVSMAYYL